MVKVSVCEANKVRLRKTWSTWVGFVSEFIQVWWFTSISKSGKLNAVLKREQKCAMAGTSHQDWISSTEVIHPWDIFLLSYECLTLNKSGLDESVQGVPHIELV